MGVVKEKPTECVDHAGRRGFVSRFYRPSDTMGFGLTEKERLMKRFIACMLGAFLVLASCQTFKSYDDTVSFIYASGEDGQNVFGFLEDGTFRLRENGALYGGRWGKNAENIQVLYQDAERNGQIELLKISFNAFKHNGMTYKKLSRGKTEAFLAAYTME